ncbi:MAG: ATP-binding protein [Candidatus Helarchaeota archaeon]
MKIIGRAKGPGSTTSEFDFITPDKTHAKIGEFVYYTNKINNSEKKILCRIVRREPARIYPNEMLATPSIDPLEIASLLGYDEAGGSDYYKLTARIIGYWDDNFGFINPRIPPVPGNKIYLAPDDFLTDILNPKKHDTPGSAYIGDLLQRPPNAVQINLDVAEIVSKHLAVLAATGSGKSYAVGVLLEEIMSRKNKGAVLVIDPHGEYDTLKEIQNEKNQLIQKHIISKDFIPKVEVKTPKDIKIMISELEFADIIGLLPNLTEKMKALLRSGYYKVRKENPRFTVKHLIKSINDVSRSSIDETTIRGLEWRIREYLAPKTREIFSETQHTLLRELFEPGQITILQFTEMEEKDQQIVVSVLLNRLLRARVNTDKNREKEDSDFYLPYPVFIVLEEAHRFAPANQTARSKNILKTILSEGRKFGIGACLISQRPGKLDSDVLSQSLTQIIMKIINPLDQTQIKHSVESVTDDMLKELPSLTKGQAIIVGEAVRTPVLVQIRRRYSSHGGISKNAPEEWMDYHSSSKKDARDRAQYPPKVEDLHSNEPEFSDDL